MRILVSNDDGVFSPGIRALAKVAAEFGQAALNAVHTAFGLDRDAPGATGG